MSATRLPNGKYMVTVQADGAVVYVAPANGIYPPRVEFSSKKRYTPLVPMDVLRTFADNELDAMDRAKLLTLLDSLAPWRQTNL